MHEIDHDRLAQLFAEQNRSHGQLTSAFSGIQESLEEIAADTKEVLDQAHHAADRSARGVAVADELSATTQELAETRAQLAQLSDLLREIRSEAAQVRSIAQQSDILAINASVEAARVGQMGKGFAVVARAVADLAKRSQLAAGRIDAAIEGGTQQLDAVTARTHEVIGKAESIALTSVETFRDVGKSIDRVLEGVTTESTRIKEVAQTASTARAQSRKLLEDQQRMMGAMVGILTGSNIVEIEVTEAPRWVARAMFIDVRSRREWNDELKHLDHAKHIPIADPDFGRRLAAIPRDTKLLFICRSGGRSARAAREAQLLGFPEPINMLGGMLALRKRFPNNAAFNRAVPRGSAGGGLPTGMPPEMQAMFRAFLAQHQSNAAR